MSAQQALLNISNLHVAVEGKTVLHGIDLAINVGEVHVIMGPNGCGKSTLAHVLAGQPGYEVLSGSISYAGHDLLGMPAEERACRGIFLGFQYPVEIPGVSNIYLLKAALNALRKYRGEDELDAMDFLDLVRGKMAELEVDEDFLHRNVNQGFSGGEKKRNEILQMRLLEPRLAILDEIDSGLDIDAMKVVARGVNATRDSDKSIVLVTHYQRLLDFVVPDQVHVMSNGVIAMSGGPELAKSLEEKGYAWIEQAAQDSGITRGRGL